jgi:hypothetical protein
VRKCHDGPLVGPFCHILVIEHRLASPAAEFSVLGKSRAIEATFAVAKIPNNQEKH